MNNETNKRSLYERLGSSEGIVALVDDIVDAHMKNPAIKARFLPYASEPERLKVIKAHTCAFFEAGSGGPAQYTGRSMLEAHRGLNVSEQEYMAAIDDILGVLEKRGIDHQSRQDVLGIAYSLKGDILRI
jgi:hemoglobin